MPTVKPRITITLTDHQHAVLLSLAGAQKVSMSSIVVDLLDTTLPVLERLAGVLHNAASAPKNVLDEIRRTANSAEIELTGIGADAMGLLDQLVHLSSSTEPTATAGRRGAVAAEPTATAGRRGAGAAGGPPTSNRGVRIVSPRAKIGSISPMKKGEKNGRVEK